MAAVVVLVGCYLSVFFFPYPRCFCITWSMRVFAPTPIARFPRISELFSRTRGFALRGWSSIAAPKISAFSSVDRSASSFFSTGSPVKATTIPGGQPWDTLIADTSGGTCWWRYLWSVKGLTFTDLMDAGVTEESAESEMMSWYSSPQIDDDGELTDGTKSPGRRDVKSEIRNPISEILSNPIRTSGAFAW